MDGVTITDLQNAKQDCDTIAAVATSTDPTTVDRLGNTRKTLAGKMADVDADWTEKKASIDSEVSTTLAAATALSATGIYANGAAANLPKGLPQSGVGAITAGSGGSSGTFAVAWSGGNFDVNPAATFTVAGGQLTAFTITGAGRYVGASPVVPTPSFAASSGLTGAAVALAAQSLIAVGQGYWVQSADGASLSLYVNSGGAPLLVPGVNPVPSHTFDATPPKSRTVRALRDSTGAFIAGERSDGSRVRWSNPNGRRVYSRLVGGQYQVFIADKLGESQLTFSGNNTAPEITVDGIMFTSDRRGFPEPYLMTAAGAGQAPLALQVTEHFQVVGQSRGSADQAGAALSTTNVDARASMLALNITGAYGPRTMLDQNPTSDDSNVDATKVTGLTPLVEALKGVRGETVSSGFAAQYLSGQPTTEKIVIDVHARGSAPYSQPAGGGVTWLAPGSPHFANGLMLQELARKYVEASGSAYRYAGTLCLHGEADAYNARGRANYLADLQAWIAAYNAQARHGSSLHRSQRMFLVQLQNLLYAGAGLLQQGIDIALAQMDAHKLHAGLVLVGPNYFLPTVDGTHNPSSGNRWNGEMFGKVARRVLKEGVLWDPVYPKLWTRSGNVVNIKFNVPVAPLVFDTSVVSDPGMAGFRYMDDSGSGITVTAVAVAADGVSVNMTLSGTSFGTNPRFGIADYTTSTSAGPTSGARSTLRDSDGEKGVLSGSPLYNYACTFQGAIV